MPTNDIFLDGTGKFQQSTENAGTIKFGEFSQTSINTGLIAVSALFTGSAVNSGTIGNYLPYETAVLVQTYSADWNTAYQFAAGGGGGAIEITTNDITDYNITTTSLITAAGGVYIASLVDGKVPSSQLPSYVDDVLEFNDLASFPATGATDTIYVDVTTKKIYRWSGSTYVEISPSPGSTDSVPEGSTNQYFTQQRASAAAPVQSVAGRTGTVVLSASDVAGLQAAVESFAPAQSVTSVAGKTGVVTLSTSDIQGLAGAIAEASAVVSVAGRTGVITLSASDIAGFNAATDARIAAQSGASLDSPAFTGTPTAPTAAAGTSNSQIANTAFVINNRGDKYRSSSTSSLTIDNGNGKTMTIGTGLSYTSQQDITVVYDASNHMHGKVVSYDSNTGALVFDVNSKTGSGTYTQWTVNVGGITSGGGDVTSVAGKTGVVTLSASDITDFTAATDARITAAVGSSVASLVNGTVPASQLPSYVDDVLEYSALASFPASGEAGIIYVDTTAKKIYRWSGSTYVEIAASPGSTDSVTEGSTNLYFTDARVDARLTTLNSNSAAWQSVYTRVNASSASWTTNVSVASAAWQQAYTRVNSSSATWQTAYTTLTANSASWASSNFGSVSATAVSLSNAVLSSYSTPVTASGDFIVITVDNKQRLIRLWDFK